MTDHISRQGLRVRSCDGRWNLETRVIESHHGRPVVTRDSDGCRRIRGATSGGHRSIQNCQHAFGPPVPHSGQDNRGFSRLVSDAKRLDLAICQKRGHSGGVYQQHRNIQFSSRFHKTGVGAHIRASGEDQELHLPMVAQRPVILEG